MPEPEYAVVGFVLADQDVNLYAVPLDSRACRLRPDMTVAGFDPRHEDVLPIADSAPWSESRLPGCLEPEDPQGWGAVMPGKAAFRALREELGLSRSLLASQLAVNIPCDAHCVAEWEDPKAPSMPPGEAWQLLEGWRRAAHHVACERLRAVTDLMAQGNCLVHSVTLVLLRDDDESQDGLPNCVHNYARRLEAAHVRQLGIDVHWSYAPKDPAQKDPTEKAAIQSDPAEKAAIQSDPAEKRAAQQGSAEKDSVSPDDLPQTLPVLNKEGLSFMLDEDGLFIGDLPAPLY